MKRAADIQAVPDSPEIIKTARQMDVIIKLDIFFSAVVSF